MSKNELRITKEMDVAGNFAEAFHTGLRKGVDSKYSALAWHAIHICPPNVWAAFCEYMTRNIKPGNVLTASRLGELLKAYDVIAISDAKKRSEIVIFTCAMNCMPQEDIESLFSWLKYGFEI